MNVLYVEDFPLDADIVQRFMARHAPYIHVHVVETLSAAREQLSGDQNWDVVLLDLFLGAEQGLDLMPMIRDADIPVVILSAHHDGPVIIDALDAGASDYIIKRENYLHQLPGILKRVIQRHAEVAMRRARTMRVAYLEPNVEDLQACLGYFASHAPQIKLLPLYDSARLYDLLPDGPDQPLPWDVLLLRCSSPTINTLEVIKRLQYGEQPLLPVLLLVDPGTEAEIIHALRQGASDYVVKTQDYLPKLVFRLENAVTRAQLQKGRATLRASQERYRTILGEMHDVVWLTELNGQLIWISPSIERYVGVSAEELLSRAVEELIPAETIAKINGFVARCGTEEVRLDPTRSVDDVMELAYFREDGSTGWTQVVFKMLRDKEGVPAQILCSGHEITESKLAQQALAESNALLNAIINSAEDIIIFSLDRDYRYVIFNERHRQVMRSVWDVEINVGDSILDAMTNPELRRLAQASMDRALAGEVFSEHQTQPELDTHFEFLWTPIRDAQDRIVGVTAFTRDITEARRNQEKLADQSLMLESVSDTVIGLDLAYRITVWNRAAESIYGWSAEEVLGKPVFDVVPTDQSGAEREANRRELEETGDWAGELVQYDRQGVARITYHRTKTVYGKDGHLKGFVDLVKDITKTREVESNLRYQALVLESISDAVIATDMEFVITKWNRGAEKIYGWEAREAIGQYMGDLFETIYLDLGRMDAYQRITQDGEWSGTVSQANKAGVALIIEARVTQFNDQDGNPLGLVAVNRDITAARRAEEQQQILSAALKAAANAVVITDLEGGIEWVNPSFTRLTGYDMEEVIGKNPREILRSGRHDSAFYEKLWRTIQDGQAWSGEMINRRKDGTLYTEEQIITPLKGKDGQPIRYIAIKQDISERKQMELERTALLARIQHQAEQTQQILESISDGMLLLDQQQHIRLVNPTAARHLAFLTPLPSSPEEQIGQPLTQLGATPTDEFLHVSEKGHPHEIGHNSRIFEIAATPVNDVGWVLVLRDVTEARERARYAEAQERLATVGQMAAGIAHDFNNIMGVIVLYAQLLQSSSNLDEKQVGRLITIQEQARNASGLIDQILDFSRRSVMSRANSDILPLFKESFKILSRTLPENVRQEFSSDEREYVVYADPTRLQQVLMNLAFNSRDAMPAGGTLGCHLGQLTIQPGDPLPLPDLVAGDWVHIRFFDTGTGISPADLPHIFEPFFTTKETGKGTGLGLSQVHGIVKQHGGSISIESEVGQGTVVNIYLPLVQHRAQPARPAERPDSLESHNESLLVVEDNDALRAAIVDAMSGLGYTVMEAGNGAEALRILDTASHRIDLLLSDLVMPEIGGMELYHAVRRQYDDVKIAIMTGYPMGKEERRLYDTGHIGWIRKPFGMADLAAYVRSVLDGAALSGEILGDGLQE